MLSNMVDFPASFGPEMNILPRCGKYRSTSRKSRNCLTFKCFKIIIHCPPQILESHPANALRAELRQFANWVLIPTTQQPDTLRAGSLSSLPTRLRVRHTARSALRSGRMQGSTPKGCQEFLFSSH